MMYDAEKHAASPDRFRQLFAGDTASMIDGTEKAVESLSDAEISGYQVAAIWQEDFNQWATADKVALTTGEKP